MGSVVAILVAAVGITASLGLAAVKLSPSWTTLFLTGLLLAVSLIIFITVRHLQLQQRRLSAPAPAPSPSSSIPPPPPPTRPEYYLFVLGSGGHTKEMLMMMDDGFCDFDRVHRRYLISSGDGMSENHLEEYEAGLRDLCRANKGASPGTYDKRTVARARRVHQPLWTVPVSALRSILDIFPVLLQPPTITTTTTTSSGKVTPPPPYPTGIFSNGPATGFFVALAAYLLRAFYVIPEDCMRFVYIESWARISTLSLTGKLLHWTGIADVFLVQHDKVAASYGLRNAGEMVFNARRPDL